MNKNEKKILVVDDDTDILDAVRFTLENEGYKVIATDKGEYAEKLYSKDRGLPALIILDILLSGKDGRTICKLLKSQKNTMHIPIIMISAHPNAEKSVKDVGADEFLAKPFQAADLLNKVEYYLH